MPDTERESLIADARSCHKPVILDLFCGAGGAAMGYHRAGFDVVGVDINPQPHYPFEFVQANALDVLRDFRPETDPASYSSSGAESNLAAYASLQSSQTNLNAPESIHSVSASDPQVEQRQVWPSRLSSSVSTHSPSESFRIDCTSGSYRFDAIHASPPCQHFTKYRNVHKDITDRYEDLVAPIRELLEETGLPYVIENVEGAPLRDPVTLCGSMFDLDVQRHRLFETNWALEPPAWPCRHKLWAPRFKSATGRKPNSRLTIEVGSWDEPIERQKTAMGVDWTITTRELSEAIPPAYTEYIGHQLLVHIGVSQGVAA